MLIHLQKTLIIGGVSIDSMTIDLRKIPSVKIGNPVSLWGSGETVELASKWADMIPNDSLSRLPERVTRVAVKRYRSTIFGTKLSSRH